MDQPALFFNRELSWLDFNWRVLYQALDERTPLLERVRFLGITASNLDEFFQKRVGGLKRQEAAGVSKLTPDGRTPSEQIALIQEAARIMHQTMTTAWEMTLKPKLEREANVGIVCYESLLESTRKWLHEYFMREIYPVLTPLAVDPGRPFPFISNLSLSLAIVVRYPQDEVDHFARIKVPPSLNRLIPLPPEPDAQKQAPSAFRFLPLEQLIVQHLDDLFGGMTILGAYAFRVTRNADLNRDEEEAEDLLAMISEELRERQFAPVVRLEIEKDTPELVRRVLLKELGLTQKDIFEVDGLLDLRACHALADLDLPQYKYETWQPIIPPQLGEEADIFSIVRQGDVLVHHPYDSFTASVQRLIEEAAVDKNVISIKQTLYRTGEASPIVRALMRAAENGKQVAVLVEVKARFDEANNIEWGRMLEEAGVHVAYGLVGLKTHAKVTLIVRKEADGLKTYCHIGTGNYHHKTARLYTDLGLMTYDPKLGHDLINLFHHLTGYVRRQTFAKALVAPQTMQADFTRLIRQEIAHQQEHGNGLIIAKMNALDDVAIIKELYAASQGGVKIHLIVRGHTRLRSGIPGLSDNIHIISILGRFLEHDRIFYFHDNGRRRIFIGSADWRHRNLAERVELIAPIEDRGLQIRLITLLKEALQDNRLAWDLACDGQYRLRQPPSPDAEHNFHLTLMRQARQRQKIAERRP